MATVKFKGSPVNTNGDLPKVGSQAPDFILTKTDMSDISLRDLSGKRAVLNIFLSVDTPVCAASVRKFNAEVDKLKNTVVLCASLDLPFALSRFCGAEGLNNVIPVSELRNREFGTRYGVRIIDGPLAGLLARSIVILDEKGKVIYTELVNEISDEPDYDKALNILR